MFSANLINDPFGDPGVYVEFKHRNSAFLFDLGDIHCLSPRKLFKIGHIFISHTHMDHFIGFDHLLRVCLGRNHHIYLYGPPGFHRQVESKINAYTWNLVENYTNDFSIYVSEINEDRKCVKLYRCRTAFEPEILIESEIFEGIVVEGTYFSVKGIFLDHRIPCLAYRFEEKTRINIKKNALEEMGLPVGAWLLELKDYILKGSSDDTPIKIWWKSPMGVLIERFMPIGELKETIVKITPGNTITYVTDIIYNEDNATRIVELAKGSDILFIEATFLDEDSEKAALKYHLTAKQAGTLAHRADVKRLILFHFSPKYKGYGHLLVDEAMRAFSGQILAI